MEEPSVKRGNVYREKGGHTLAVSDLKYERDSFHVHTSSLLFVVSLSY